MQFLRRSAGLFCLTALAAFAQSDRGTITGTVSDPANAVMAGAAVEARNAETGSTYQTATSETGNYTLSQLPIGTYELNVTAQGFKRYVRQNVPVSVAGTVRVDIQMEVGATSESITVTDTVTLLKTESGELSHNISSTQLNRLPAITVAGGTGLGNVRNPLQAITLLPGAQFANDNTLRVNGMPSSSHAIRIEGQDATNGIWRQLNQATQSGLDAIEEVSVQTSNYAAEYGQAGGGYFNYTMKSGTNQYHGSAYDYFVNEALNSPTPFTSTAEGKHIRNKQRRNDYGFTFGGPIWIPKVYNGKDRTFFFFNFEQFRERQTIATGLATVPTAAYRVGNFQSAQLAQLTIGGQPAVDSLGRPLFQNQVFDPGTHRLGPDGNPIRDPFVNNTIPLTSQDPVALKIQSFIPQPLGAGASQLVNNYSIPAYDNFRHTTIPSVKLDHNLNTNVKISGFYSENRQISPNANGYPAPFTPAAPQDQRSRTIRVNYDHTVTPTMLLHLGAGLLYTHIPSIPPEFNQSELGWGGNFYASQFPNIVGISDGVGFFPPVRGGTTVPLGSGFMYEYSKEYKPTANTYLTWVKGNHTFKFGGEMIVDGIITKNKSRANGIFGFAAQQSGNPWENGRGTNQFTGFSYASFLLGAATSLQVSEVTDTRLGNHSFGFYAQDTWKVTRKFTLDYGLRYDYVTLLKEQYGRMQSAAFNTPNPVAGNRLGNVIYEATCGCSFNNNYKFAFGPRLGAAYQINDKTVFRAGVGMMYSSAPNNAFLSLSVADFYTLSTPEYALPAALLRDGNPFAPGNRFGNPPVVFPDFSPHYPTLQAPGIRPPQMVFISIDRNAGRPPRILEWSLSLQREVMRDLVVEASYVGNRGAWWTGPLLAAQNYNALTIDGLRQNFDLDINNATDRALLTTPISSPAVVSRFPFFSNRNNVYPGFTASQPLNQALRPYPQWLGVPPFLGPPLGTSWYDSLQLKATKRYSYGLDFTAAYTFQKELTLGVGSDTSYLTPNPPLINDVYNYRQNKQISSFSRPHMFVLAANYTTPGFNADSAGFRTLSWLVRDWTVGAVLRYQSGSPIRVPASNNALFTQLRRTDNPAIWGGATTFWNRVPGQDLLMVDPNSKSFDPTRTLALNPAAWTDAAPGQYGTAAPYYNDYRWQRQPQESMSLGRNFVLHRDRSIVLNVRAELFNVFNRTFLSSPTATNPAAPTTCLGACNTGAALNAGYGFINTFNGAGTQPRTGQIVARFTF